MDDGGAKTILPEEKQAQLAQYLESENAAPEVVSFVFNFAIESEASDILFEPKDQGAVIRVRIDGIVHILTELSQELFLNIVSRLKVMAGLDVTLHTVSQEGKISYETQGRTVNARIAVGDTILGEMAVLRLHDSSNAVTDITRIGLQGPAAQSYRNLLQSKSGLILICGPTGSGKTSTLYSSLQVLNSGQNNIISVEDPVEYLLPGINQMQVDSQHGISFAEGLKIILRLNPDIIFVGEIRDQETAHIAIEAAMTGHLVLSTIHANSAVASISRLVDLNIDKFFINAAVIGALSQRLVRRTCTECGRDVPPSDQELEFYHRVTGRNLTTQFKGAGCIHCANTGFKGRMAIFEVMTVNDTVRSLLSKGASERTITQSLVQEGYISILNDGMMKVDQRLTTVGEVISNAFVAN